MPTILLIRHGETDWSRSGQIMGSRPVPLNGNGMAQASRLATQLTVLKHLLLYSSPTLRARQTADILASTLRVPVQEEPALREVNLGAWEGRYWHELAGTPVRRNFYRMIHEARPPGGETLGEVQQRAVEAVQRLIQLAGSTPLVAVTHADVIRAIVAYYLNTDFWTVRQMQIAHASVTALAITSSSATLLCLSALPHFEWLSSA
jgi:broad specificity phosphatase PhoE